LAVAAHFPMGPRALGIEGSSAVLASAEADRQQFSVSHRTLSELHTNYNSVPYSD